MNIKVFHYYEEETHGHFTWGEGWHEPKAIKDYYTCLISKNVQLTTNQAGYILINTKSTSKNKRGDFDLKMSKRFAHFLGTDWDVIDSEDELVDGHEIAQKTIAKTLDELSGAKIKHDYFLKQVYYSFAKILDNSTNNIRKSIYLYYIDLFREMEIDDLNSKIDFFDIDKYTFEYALESYIKSVNDYITNEWKNCMFSLSNKQRNKIKENLFFKGFDSDNTQSILKGILNRIDYDCELSNEFYGHRLNENEVKISDWGNNYLRQNNENQNNTTPLNKLNNCFIRKKLYPLDISLYYKDLKMTYFLFKLGATKSTFSDLTLEYIEGKIKLHSGEYYNQKELKDSSIQNNRYGLDKETINVLNSIEKEDLCFNWQKVAKGLNVHIQNIMQNDELRDSSQNIDNPYTHIKNVIIQPIEPNKNV